MKNTWVWVVVIILVLGVGYYYKHQIKLLLMGSPAPATMNYGSPSASASTSPSKELITWATGTGGQYAVAANGMTLYRFDKDTKGVSNCSGSCAGLWPPYVSATTPSTLPANVTLIKRTDGSMQFAYKGMPLYYYSGDQKAGDTTGDGVNGTWHLVNQ